MTDRLAMTETIARACGWEFYDANGGVEVVAPEDCEGWKFSESFDPFTSEADWFRAFDAMGLREVMITQTKRIGAPDVWSVSLGWANGTLDGVRAEHPDRLTAMALALHAAARVKLREVER